MENSVDPDKIANDRNQDLVLSKMDSTGQGLNLGSAGQGLILVWSLNGGKITCVSGNCLTPVPVINC